MPGPPGQCPGQEHQQAGHQHPAQGQEEEAPGTGLDGQYHAHPGGQQRGEQDPQQEQGRRIHQVGGAQDGSAQQGKHEKFEGWKGPPGQAVQDGSPLFCIRHYQHAAAPACGGRARLRLVLSSGVKSSGRSGSSGNTTSSKDGCPRMAVPEGASRGSPGGALRKGWALRGGFFFRRGRLVGLGGSSSGKLMVASSLSFFQAYYTTTKTPGYAWRL